MISATSKNNVPLVSSNPPRFPAIENAWQGKPAHKTSKLSGISCFVSSFVISPHALYPQFALYVCFASLSHSLVPTHFPHKFCNAKRNPPIPANRSINLNLGLSIGGKGTSKVSKIPYCKASSAASFETSCSGYLCSKISLVNAIASSL